MSLKNTWVTGETYAASDQNAVASAVNTNSTTVAALQGITGAAVVTTESTSSATYADLATTTDTVTVTVPASGKVLVSLFSQWTHLTGTFAYAYMSFALSGGNTLAAADARSAYRAPGFAGETASLCAQFLLTGLTPGSTVFKMKYRVASGTSASFANRNIAVIPLP